MLYWLLYEQLFSYFSPFRVFGYVTFRTALASLTALLLCLLLSLSVQAYSFNSYSINAQIDGGLVTQTLTVDLFNDDLGPISSGTFSLPSTS